MDPLLGQIIFFAGNFVPEGWKECNGESLPINEFTALYSVLGPLYGGNATTFNLPDLRGRVPVGIDSTSLNLPGASLVGHTGGSKTAPVNVTLPASVTLTVDNLPAHSHKATFTPTGGGGGSSDVSIAIPVVGTNGNTSQPGIGVNLATATADTSGAGGPLNAPANIYSNAATTTTLKPFTATITGGGSSTAGSVSVANTGNGTSLSIPATAKGDVSTVQPFQAFRYIIAIEGIYPRRPPK